MDPPIAHFDALLAYMDPGRNVFRRFQMFTAGHNPSMRHAHRSGPCLARQPLMLNRRNFARLATAGLSAGLFSRWPASLHAQQEGSWPQARLSGDATLKVDPSQFMGLAQIRSWYGELDAMGLRATGSPAHERFIDILQDRMQRVGISGVHADPVRFERWTPKSWGLDIIDGPGAGPVPVSSYVPYSGTLPPQGITGPLVYIQGEQMPPRGSLSGRIVLTDIAFRPATLAGLTRLSYQKYDPEHVLNPGRDHTRVSPQVLLRRVNEMRAAGAAGVIAILPLDDAAAKGLYAPYHGFILQCPGLYVSNTTGARLRQIAGSGVRVRMRLDAVVDDGASRNLIGIIPGRTDELVILNSHTDGPNGTEDDGPNAILGMAQYLTRIPREQLPRSIMILLTTGHFVGGAGARAFVAQHRGDILPRVAAAVTVEHVGAKEMAITSSGSFQATGGFEPGIVFMPPNADVLGQRVMAGLAAGKIGGTFVSGPTNPRPTSNRTEIAWPGEGQHLWNNGGLADANYITAPNYLFSGGFPTAAYTDFDRIRSASMGFVDLALDLARTPKQSLAVPPPPDYSG